MPQYLKLSSLALAAVATLAACGGGGGDDHGDGETPPAPVVLGDTVAVTAANRVISFNRTTPGTISSNVALSGLAGGESLVGIDVRPADGAIYAVSSTNRIYTLDASTGVLTLKSTLSVPLSLIHI